MGLERAALEASPVHTGTCRPVALGVVGARDDEVPRGLWTTGGCAQGSPGNLDTFQVDSEQSQRIPIFSLQCLVTLLFWKALIFH